MADTKSNPKVSPETQVAQGLHYMDPATGSVMPPIYPASTYARDVNHELINPAHSYSRDQNPTYDLPQAMLARLEGGADALLFSSGMAAATAVFRALRPGDHVVVPTVMYWGLRNWLLDFADTWQIGVNQYDATDETALAAAIKPGKTRLVWVETPTNPLWEVTDIAAAAKLAHAAGALLGVDSTVATPVHTRPIELGADIVMHSATKSLNGHSDVVAGALIAARHDAFWERVCKERGESGAIPGPFEAWLLQRGMRTLFVRVQRASSNALNIAQHFEHHAAITAVLYPGLPGAEGHAVACKQMQNGFGAMLSIRINGGRAQAIKVAGRLNVFTRATSLGGVESLVEHRASIEGADSPVPDDLLRLSIGIENVDDLIADLEQALIG